MATFERAVQIAAKAHLNQTDKQGQPYLLHPLRVMQLVNDLDAKIVAVLHDVVEDTSVTLDDLVQAGFDQTIIDAVQCVTHTEELSYTDYVVDCKANPLARQVKLADLQDNTRLDRALFRGSSEQRDLARLKKYLLSYQFLTDLITETEYRNLMNS